MITDTMTLKQALLARQEAIRLWSIESSYQSLLNRELTIATATGRDEQAQRLEQKISSTSKDMEDALVVMNEACLKVRTLFGKDDSRHV